jgi:hypothetical protein
MWKGIQEQAVQNKGMGSACLYQVTAIHPDKQKRQARPMEKQCHNKFFNMALNTTKHKMNIQYLLQCDNPSHGVLILKTKHCGDDHNNTNNNF